MRAFAMVLVLVGCSSMPVATDAPVAPGDAGDFVSCTECPLAVCVAGVVECAPSAGMTADCTGCVPRCHNGSGTTTDEPLACNASGGVDCTVTGGLAECFRPWP